MPIQSRISMIWFHFWMKLVLSVKQENNYYFTETWEPSLYDEKDNVENALWSKTNTNLMTPVERAIENLIDQ